MNVGPKFLPLIGVIIGTVVFSFFGNAFADSGIQIDHANDWITLSNGTLAPYNLTQTSNAITLFSKQGSFIFNNSTCSFSFYNSSSTSGTQLIPFDNYKVLAELNGTTTWNAVNVINNAACITHIYENSTAVTLAVTKSSAGNGLFQVNYTKAVDLPLKISFKAVNQNPSWRNYHIGMKETIAVPRLITLGDTTYDLSLHNNTSLNRTWITEHGSQLLKLTSNVHYDMGIGWNHANSITIHYSGGQASLDIDYTYNTPILSPSQSILIDPTLDVQTAVFNSDTNYSPTLSVTVGNNANRLLLVRLQYSNSLSNPSDPTSVTYGAQTMTKAITADNSGGNVRSTIYYLIAPTVGTASVTVNFAESSGTEYYGIVATSLYNVDQVSGIGATNSTTTRFTTTPGINITPTHGNSWIFDSMTSGSNTATPTGSATLDYSQLLGNSIYGSTQHNSTPTIGSKNTLSWTINNANAFDALTAVEIRQVTPSSPTLTANTLNDTAIKSSWSSSTGASWYELNYTTPFTGSTWKIAVNQSGTSYTLTGLNPNTQYLFKVYAGNSSGTSQASTAKGNYTYPFMYSAKKADNSTLFSGTVMNKNSSSSGTYTLSSGVYNFTGLIMGKLQNFTIKDSATLFVVNKTLNVNASRLSLHIASNDFFVTCPVTGPSPAIELFTNDTDGHHITAFSNPTCYSNGTVKWHVYYTANGKSPASYYTSVKVQILNSTYLAPPTSLKANSTAMSMSLVNPWLLSNNTLVGTGYQTKGIYFSLQLGTNPAYQPVNYTAGFLTFNQSNPVTFPISFSSLNPSCSDTHVTITYPNNYHLQVNVTYSIEQKTITYNNPSSSSAGLGLYQTTFDFTNATNDVITIIASNAGNPNQEAVYSVPPNQSCLNTNTNSSIPIIQDIKDFQKGKYGTKGNIGAINVVVLIALIFGMIGLNRVNEALGMAVMIMILGALSYFNIITWPTVMVPAIALVALIGIGSSKKLPWS